MGQTDALAAVLVTGHLCHDLRGDVARGGEAVRLLDQRAGDNGAVLEHVLQIDQVTVMHVLGKVVHIVKVDQPLLMGLHDILREQDSARDILGDLARHIVALHAVNGGVLIGVFLLGLLVIALDQAEDLVVRRVGAARQRAGVAVLDIALGHLKGALLHDLIFHQILNLLHGGGTSHFQAALLHVGGDGHDLLLAQLAAVLIGIVGLCDRNDDLCDVKYGLRAVSFDNLHGTTP